MNKAQLKQLIKEVIQEIENDDRPHADVDIDLSKLGKGLSGILQDVPINYNHTSVGYSAGEAPSWDSPGDDESFDFDVTYTAFEDTKDSSGNLVFEKGEKIPESAIDEKSRKNIDDEIIGKFRS